MHLVKGIPTTYRNLIEKMCLDLVNEQKDLMKKSEKVLFIWQNIIFPHVGR